jgi:hypothetical protein
VWVQCPARSTSLESPRASASAAVGAPAADGAPSVALPVSAVVVSLRRRRRIRQSLPRDVDVPSPRRPLRPSLQLLMVVTQWHGMPARSPCPLLQLPLPRWMPVWRLALQERSHLRCYRCCGTMTTYLSAGRTRRRDGGAIFLLRLLHSGRSWWWRRQLLLRPQWPLLPRCPRRLATPMPPRRPQPSPVRVCPPAMLPFLLRIRP